MAANGNLIFQDTNKATFVGANSNVVIDTVHASFGVGVDVNGPTSNLHVVGNCFVSTDFTASTLSGNGSGLTALNAANVTTGTLAVTRGGTGTTTSTGTGSVVLSDAPTFTGDVTFDTNTLFVDSVNDRVGVGTTSPGGKLDIRGSVSDPSIPTVHIGDNAADFGDYGMVNLVRNPTESGTKAHLAFIRNGNTIFSQGYYNNTNTFGFWPSFGSVANTPAMAFATNGNVGIGTTNPVAKLNIQGTSEGAPPTSGGEGTSNGLFRLRDNFNVSLDIGTLGASPWTTWLQVADASNMSGEYPLSLNPNGGNVGIGNKSPLSKLDLFDTGGCRMRLTTDGSTAQGTIDIIRGDGNRSPLNYTYGASNYTDWRIGSDDITDYHFVIRAKTTNLDVRCLTITNTGNVGIGTTSPDSTLDVHGTGIHINGTVLRAMSAIGVVASGNYVKLCDFSALPTSTGGVCAILINWGGGSEGGTYRYWQGHAAGIVSFNTYSDGNGTYNAAPSEPVTLNHHYHHRAVGPLTFIIDSDSANSAYGRQSLYVAPAAGIDNMSFSVIAMPLRR
jgi:hypothetical protein